MIDALHAAGLARLAPLGGGPSLLLRTAHLPHGVREGDVLVEGRLSPALRSSLLRAQRRLRAQARRGGFTLTDGGGDTRPLTAEGER